MVCLRCSGVVVEDRFMDWPARWRCVKCGDVQDSMSVQNYPAQQEKDSPKYADDWGEEVYLGSESIVGLDIMHVGQFGLRTCNSLAP